MSKFMSLLDKASTAVTYAMLIAMVIVVAIILGLVFPPTAAYLGF